MKKSIVLSAMAISLGMTSTYAQKFDKEKTAVDIQQKKYDEAKAAIDKAEADPALASDPTVLAMDNHFWGTISSDSAASGKYPNLYESAYSSFSKLRSVVSDTSKLNTLLRDPYTYGVSTPNYIYGTSFNLGKDAFNKKDWKDAFSKFSRATDMGNFLIQNGFTQGGKNGLDTMTVLYTGFAAQNAGKENAAYNDSAAVYYNELASRGIATPDMVQMYDFLIKYYKDKGDNAKHTQYLAFAKAHYPDNKDYWDQISSQEMTEGKSLTELLAEYKSMKSSNQLTADKADLLLDAISSQEKEDTTITPALKEETDKTRIDGYSLIYNEKKNPLYAYNAGIVLYSQFSDLEDAFAASRGEGAALKAKRASIEQKEAPIVDDGIKWFETAFNDLKDKTDRSRQETQVAKQSTRILSVLYQWKMSKAQGKNPADFDKYEKLFNQYDALYDKY